VGRRANPLPRPAGGMSATACPAAHSAPETAQEPTGEAKGPFRGMNLRRRGNAVEAAAAASSAATGGTREPGPQRSEHRAAERIGAAFITHCWS